jgi:hypothetical protein
VYKYYSCSLRFGLKYDRFRSPAMTVLRSLIYINPILLRADSISVSVWKNHEFNKMEVKQVTAVMWYIRHRGFGVPITSGTDSKSSGQSSAMYHVQGGSDTWTSDRPVKIRVSHRALLFKRKPYNKSLLVQVRRLKVLWFRMTFDVVTWKNVSCLSE